MPVTYKVVMVGSEEGFAASCPSLRGCHSQGATEKEALENIRIAIKEWLQAEMDESTKLKTRKIKVPKLNIIETEVTV